MADELTFEIVEGAEALALADEILDLCHVLFPDFTDSYLTDRLPRITGLAVVAARGADGTLLARIIHRPQVWMREARARRSQRSRPGWCELRWTQTSGMWGKKRSRTQPPTLMTRRRRVSNGRRGA